MLSGADGSSAVATLENGAALRLASPDVFNGSALLSIRPEAIRLSRATVASTGLRGEITHRIFLGASAEYSIAVPGLGSILVLSGRDAGGSAELFEPGTEVELAIAPEAVRIFSVQS